MIRVTVELLPYGSEVGKRVLGVTKIANDGSGSLTCGNYTYEMRGKRGVLMCTGAVYGFPRKRLLAWDLVHRVLDMAVGERNRRPGGSMRLAKR